MAKYSEKAQKKIGEVMDEWKEGKLKTSAGQKVTSQKQAVAIGISEARAEGDKAPSKKKASSTTKKKVSASRSSSK